MSPNQTTGGGASNGAAASFAEQLRIARGKRSQSEAALLCARSVRTLQNWEIGRNVPDRAVQADALAKLRRPKRGRKETNDPSSATGANTNDERKTR